MKYAIIIKRSLVFLLLTTILFNFLTLTSCKKESENVFTGFDHYNNKYKDDVPGGRKIKVSGKEYIFSDIMVRDRDGVLDVSAQNNLEILYEFVFVKFEDEETVTFNDYNYGAFFNMEPTRGKREGNVLTVSKTNNTGDYTHDIRIEIHKDKIIMIHNGNFYNEPEKYATITFKLYESQE